MGAYIETGVIGYVFGEMWRRGVLTPRDRRFITLSCVGFAGAITPIETHVWAALNSGDLTYAEFDEFVLHFGTQLGWPKASVMQWYGMTSMFKLAEERGIELEAHDFEQWVDPIDDQERRRRGEAAYRAVLGVDPPTATSPFRGRAYLDFLLERSGLATAICPDVIAASSASVVQPPPGWTRRSASTSGPHWMPANSPARSSKSS